jgi:hypothetical protein
MKPDTRSINIGVLFLCLALGTGLSMASPKPAASPGQDKKTATKAELHDSMRKLWEDHITWTRLFLVSAVADLPDKQATTDRLLKNQEDIGGAIKPYYGDEAGDKLTRLLKEHITLAAEIVAAAKAQEAAKAEEAKQRWFGNADEIAAFLSGANPNWPKDEMQQMMHEHLNLTASEVQNRLQGNYAAEIADYEKVHEQILHMADMLSEGIIKQFPKKF